MSGDMSEDTFNRWMNALHPMFHPYRGLILMSTKTPPPVAPSPEELKAKKDAYERELARLEAMADQIDAALRDLKEQTHA
jgi:hypothetical protein